MMQTNQMGTGFHNSDLLDELTFHNLDKRIKSNIEKSTSLHLELWSLLSEDIPGRIQYILYLIFLRSDSIDGHRIKDNFTE